MRLSEAIRLGAMLRPQGRGKFLEQGATCALGGALEAVGEEPMKYGMGNYGAVERRWPVVNTRAPHPLGERAGYVYPTPIWRAIEDLNDCRGWTREQIADWLEPIEAAYESEQQAKPVSVP